MDNTAIKIEAVGKVFKLPHEKQTSLKSIFVNSFRLKKGYELQEALQDISFQIQKGEFFGIIGRNGSGKSTLLKMLAGIYVPTSGNIHINGSLTPFIELGVGFNPELTGRENVYLNGALLGFSRKEMQGMYKSIVDFAELNKFMDQKLKNYSSGMQVRLAFSIAIRAQSDILLIDEVLAVGDAAFQQKCFTYFRKLKKNKQTVVFVTHELRSVEEFCDRAAIIDRGKLLSVGAARETVSRYQTVLSESEPKHSNIKRQNRPGTGDCVINSVRILDKNDKPALHIRAGESFSVEVGYQAKATTDIVAGISIDDESGTVLLGPNTQEADIKIHIKPGHHKLWARFLDNNLAPGNYPLTVALFNESGFTPFDYYDNAAKLKILGEPIHGKINSRPKWSIG